LQVITKLSAETLDQPFGLTIGNFDGVHRGHREVLDYVRKKCNEKKEKLVVMSFNPHPQEILNPGNYFLINSMEEKRCLLESCGVDYLCEIKFDRNFSTQSPQEFLENHIFSNKKLKSLFLGHDFTFGANKSGGHELAEDFCTKNQVSLENLEKFEFEGERVSSSLVRDCVQAGEVEKASEFLGRSYFISGRIEKGDGRGRKIGFPTANVGFEKNRIIPSTGVYATETRIGKLNYHSVTNIGVKPTFLEDGGLTVESHILDFDRDIYGELVQVHFLKKLRNEKKFDSVNDLIKQIGNDVQTTRDFFEKA
jgi:riboflavin kinase/FMN adenylyltransferase